MPPKLIKRPPKLVKARPRLVKFVPMFTPDLADYPQPERRVMNEKGLFVWPLRHCLPDPHFPNWKPNLELLKWCVMLNRKVVFASTDKKSAIEWAEKVGKLTNLSHRASPS